MRRRDAGPGSRAVAASVAVLCAVVTALAAGAVGAVRSGGALQPPGGDDSEPAPSRATERQYRALGPGLFTIEVHSGNDGSRSSLGSGYLATADGLIVTNYHVVSAFIDEPQRYRLRAKSASWDGPVTLVRFDMFNDLAIVRAEGVTARPLPIAKQLPDEGARVHAFGNPEGLGLSVIEGLFNGLAEKGLVDRMLLSMPLNSGMSGGPILDARGAVIGTNVSIMRGSNSLSFGVPVDKTHALLARADTVALDQRALRSELTRQLADSEKATTSRLLAALDEPPANGKLVDVGGIAMVPLPGLFDCWDGSDEYRDEGLTKHRFGCNLQFAPDFSSLGEVSAVWWTLERFALARPPGGRFGLFSFMSSHAEGHSTVGPIDPTNGKTSTWECASRRVPFAERRWKATTCVIAFVKHPGFSTFELAATSLDETSGASFLQLHARGFTAESFRGIATRFLGRLR